MVILWVIIIVIIIIIIAVVFIRGRNILRNSWREE